MYYDNKSNFYIKQYGSTVVIAVLTILLLVSGAYIYYLINVNPDINLEQANNATDVQVEENVNKQEEPKEEVDNKPLKNDVVKTTAYFDNLESSKFSKIATVTGIKNSNQITIETADSIIEAQLIGINLDYVDVNKYIDNLRTNLLNKEVKVVFDKERKTNNIYNVYIYVNDKLYNAEVLKSGVATLKSERVNISLTKTLGQAQKEARDNKAGVWNK